MYTTYGSAAARKKRTQPAHLSTHVGSNTDFLDVLRRPTYFDVVGRVRRENVSFVVNKGPDVLQEMAEGARAQEETMLDVDKEKLDT